MVNLNLKMKETNKQTEGAQPFSISKSRPVVGFKVYCFKTNTSIIYQ